jgi:hypothetical protein
MIIARKQSLIALTYFLIAATLGIVLRLFPITDFDATYRFIVHTHSHIALLGWVYISLTTLLFHIFIAKEAKSKYTYLFWSTQLTIIGMLLSFPFIGYALFSILFSTLFIVCSYWFLYFFKKNNLCDTTKTSYKFIHTSLMFMAISSIGPWSLGAIMNTLGTTSHWYKNAIYFYLHFQYNGWFIFCLLGLFIYFLENRYTNISQKKLQQFYKLMLWSCILTLVLSFLWIKPPIWIYGISSVGAILQCLAVFMFFKILKKSNNQQKKNTFMYKILKVVLFLFLIKVVLQLASSIPFFVELTFKTIDFVIGYLHLVFLGIVSISILILMKQYQLLIISKTWIQLFISGFIISELFIFYKGFCVWQQLPIIENYYTILMLTSTLIPIAICGVFFQNVKTIFSTQPKSL